MLALITSVTSNKGTLICVRIQNLHEFACFCVYLFLLQDFLQELCFTPDCRGLISKIVIFSSSGLVKREVSKSLYKI